MQQLDQDTPRKFCFDHYIGQVLGISNFFDYTGKSTTSLLAFYPLGSSIWDTSESQYILPARISPRADEAVQAVQEDKALWYVLLKYFSCTLVA